MALSSNPSWNACRTSGGGATMEAVDWVREVNLDHPVMENLVAHCLQPFLVDQSGLVPKPPDLCNLGCRPSLSLGAAGVPEAKLSERNAALAAKPPALPPLGSLVGHLPKEPLKANCVTHHGVDRDLEAALDLLLTKSKVPSKPPQVLVGDQL